MASAGVDLAQVSHATRAYRCTKPVQNTEKQIDETLERKILDILDAHRIMTVATLRPDGWP